MAGIALGTVNDESSIVLKVGILDSEGSPATITSGTWTLLLNEDPDTLINNRLKVIFPTQNADGYYYIGLTGDDLKYGDGTTRYVLIEATYSNSYTGTILNVKEYASFSIADLRNVPNTLS